MSKLRFILGRANSDRSRQLYDSVLSHIQKGEQAFLITPEQSSYVAEKRLSGKAGTGLFHSEVLSLDYLYDRVLKQAGNSLPYLSELGLTMATRRIAELNGDSLKAFSSAVHHQGFCSEIAGLFSNMKKSAISPSDLSAVSERLPEGTLLKDKIRDLSLLYNESEQFLNDRYLTVDDRANAAIREIKNSFLKDSFVYFDDMTDTSCQFLSLVRELLLYTKEVTFSITDDPSSQDPELFEPARTQQEKLNDIAAELGIPVQTTVCNHTDERNASLTHAEKHLFTFPYEKFTGEPEGITLTGASSRQSEAEAVCDSILEDIQNGIRYRDIAIVVSDPDSNRTVLRRSLELRGIPYFLDMKKAALSHAAAEVIQCALNAVTENFPASELVQLAKSGYSGLTRQQSETFENYVLRFGIRNNMFLDHFHHKDEYPMAEGARKELVDPLLRLKRNLADPTVSDKLNALYDYLTDIRLPQQLKARAQELVQNGYAREAAEHEELWHLLTDLFDQLYVILGDSRMSREDFSSVIREGLSGISLGVIPDTADRVLVGDTVRTRLSGKIRVLYVMGANDGMLPANRYDDSIINDAELDVLKGKGLPVWEKSSHGSTVDMYRLYCLFGAVTDKLVVSYSFASDDKELLIAPLARRIPIMFSDSVCRTILDGSKTMPSCQRDGLRMLSALLREPEPDAEVRKKEKQLHDLYQMDETSREIVRAMEENAKGRVSPSPLDRKIARLLYGEKNEMSASRLEQFNRCEFQHFITYGLKAKPRAEATERATDIGTLYHDILKSFLIYCTENKLSLRNMPKERALSIVDEVIPSVLETYKEGLYTFDKHLKASLFLSVDTVKQTVSAMLKQIKAGKFDPVHAEVKFGDGELFPAVEIPMPDGRILHLSGIVDRIDKAVEQTDQDDVEYLRVIDYKTGGRKMDYGAILDGINLQLPLYLGAVTKLQGIPAAMYYMPVRVAQPKDGEKTEEVLGKNFRMNGLTLNDVKVLEDTDTGMSGSSTVVSNLRRNKSGDYTGPICSDREMKSLIKKAEQIAGFTGEAMMTGNTAVNPREGACDYCDFKSICRFDVKLKDCRKRKKKKIKQDQFFELLREGDGNGKNMD